MKYNNLDQKINDLLQILNRDRLVGYLQEYLNNSAEESRVAPAIVVIMYAVVADEGLTEAEKTIAMNSLREADSDNSLNLSVEIILTRLKKINPLQHLIQSATELSLTGELSDIGITQEDNLRFHKALLSKFKNRKPTDMLAVLLSEINNRPKPNWNALASSLLNAITKIGPEIQAIEGMRIETLYSIFETLVALFPKQTIHALSLYYKSTKEA